MARNQGQGQLEERPGPGLIDGAAEHDGDKAQPLRAAGAQWLITIMLPEGRLELDWAPREEWETGQEGPDWQEELYGRYLQGSGDWLLTLGFVRDSAGISPSLNYLRSIAALFIRKLSMVPELEELRGGAGAELDREEMDGLLEEAPFLYGSEHLNDLWLGCIWDQLHRIYAEGIADYQGTVRQWFAARNPAIQPVGKVFFHLVENKLGEQPFSFLATYAADLTREGKSRHLPLKNALLEYGENSGKLLELLSTVHRAAEKSGFIDELVDTGEIFHPLELTASEAYTFLTEVLIYEEAGILCRIPRWWHSRSAALKLSVSVGQKPPSRLGMEALVDFRAQLSMDGQPLDPDELRRLLSEAEGLLYIKGKWVEVNHDRLRDTLAAYERAQKMAGHSGLGIIEALRLQWDAGKALRADEAACEIEITNGEWLRTVVEQLRQPEAIQPVCLDGGFKANLRAYQEKGVSWLHHMKTLGLGACLADDMGLGKTVQVIALLHFMKSRQQEKTLLVVPASLISNWVEEVARFAPALVTYVLHGSAGDRRKEAGDGSGSEASSRIGDADLVITTYGMLLKLDWLKEIQWDNLVLDEAQAIKNPSAKQTRLVKQLPASYRIAMTGTPIENRLGDMWSLFDFLNKGLLGSAKEFTTFTKRLEKSHQGYSRLRQTISPFILRRLKTDKSVISDLPEKIEMKTYAGLTRKQIALYGKLTEELRQRIESPLDDMARKGLVLSYLMKFKQLCNHPDQYMGQSGYEEEESGKWLRLREICEAIRDKRERVLVFTQFREIAEPLAVFLAEVFGHKGLVLHGGTAVGKRQEMVARFQGPDYIPFMVLSIKAGGVGLNLTSANHVIHFDRWWNPAVENQATDRAFRIGQRKNVIVHKFIAKGTVEEKIDQMIEDKVKLARDIVPDMQENWITEMDNTQLLELFRLS